MMGEGSQAAVPIAKSHCWLLVISVASSFFEVCVSNLLILSEVWESSEKRE